MKRMKMLSKNLQRSSEGCPDAWTRYDRSCYHGNSSEVTVQEAIDNCRLHHAHLVYIEDHGGNEFVKGFMDAEVPSVWLGARYDRSRQQWFWFGDSDIVDGNQSDVRFNTRWAYGLSPPAASKYCSAVGRDGWWNFVDCSETRPFVCQKPRSCQIGWYNADCSARCHCRRADLCRREDGVCLTGCSPGWTGASCNTGNPMPEASFHCLKTSDTAGDLRAELTVDVKGRQYSVIQAVNEKGTPLPCTLTKVAQRSHHVFITLVLQRVFVDLNDTGSLDNNETKSENASAENTTTSVVAQSKGVRPPTTLNAPGVTASGKTTLSTASVTKSGKTTLSTASVTKSGKTTLSTASLTKSGKTTLSADSVAKNGKTTLSTASVTKSGKTTLSTASVTKSGKTTLSTASVAKSGKTTLSTASVAKSGKTTLSTASVTKSGKTTLSTASVTKSGKTTLSTASVAKNGKTTLSTASVAKSGATTLSTTSVTKNGKTTLSTTSVTKNGHAKNSTTAAPNTTPVTNESVTVTTSRKKGEDVTVTSSRQKGEDVTVTSIRQKGEDVTVTTSQGDRNETKARKCGASSDRSSGPGEECVASRSENGSITWLIQFKEFPDVETGNDVTVEVTCNLGDVGDLEFTDSILDDSEQGELLEAAMMPVVTSVYVSDADTGQSVEHFHLGQRLQLHVDVQGLADYECGFPHSCLVRPQGGGEGQEIKILDKDGCGQENWPVKNLFAREKGQFISNAFPAFSLGSDAIELECRVHVLVISHPQECQTVGLYSHNVIY
ncbi:hypothetical protein ACOMHN_003106 [Nucella lapillus]